METSAAREPVVCPNATAAAESLVPTCMFAPERGREDDPCGAEGLADCDGTNGDSADHLDLSSKVGLIATASCYGSTLTSFPPELYLSCVREYYSSVVLFRIGVCALCGSNCLAWCNISSVLEFVWPHKQRSAGCVRG